MALELHTHPLSSYCWKVAIALYELGAPFEAITVDLGDPAARAAHAVISPFGKIPALRDTTRGRDLFETSVMVEYLDRHYPGPARLIPQDPDQALAVRLWDRIFDLHVHNVFQRIVADRLRPQGQSHAPTVEEARAGLRQAYGVLQERLAAGPWATGGLFTLADCAAAPALFYADVLEPMDAWPAAKAYRQRLLARPSVARAIEEAKPFFEFFPGTEAERARM